jgi:hypothetical protein
MSLIDHNTLKDLRFLFQATPHSSSNVYCLKNGVCRGDIFVERRGFEYDIRIASFYNGVQDNEFLRTVTTEKELKLFFEHCLNIEL